MIRIMISLLLFAAFTASGALSYLDALVSKAGSVAGITLPTGAVLSPDGNNLYIVCGTQGSIAWFSIDTAAKKTVFGGSLTAVTSLQGAVNVAVSPDGAHVYVAGSKNSVIAIFTRDSKSGACTFRESIGQTSFGTNGLSCLAISPDGKQLYTAGTVSHVLTVFDREASTGKLTYKTKYTNLPGLDSIVSIATSHDGKYVFTASPRAQGSPRGAVMVLVRNPETGELTLSQEMRDVQQVDGSIDSSLSRGLHFSSKILVSDDDKNMYVGGDSTIVTFLRNPNPDSGTFQNIGSIGGITPHASMDLCNRSLYVFLTNGTAKKFTGESGGVLMIVSSGSVQIGGEPNICIIGGNGTLLLLAAQGRLNTYSPGFTLANTVTEGMGGLEGLKTIESLAGSPDSKFVYAVSSTDTGIALLSRNTSGALSYGSLLPSGGIRASKKIRMSGDGKNIYVIEEGAVKTFSRNVDDGSSTLLSRIAYGATGVQGLLSCSDIALSPDDKNIYVVSKNDSAITVFDRDGKTGDLTFANCTKKGSEGVDDMAWPSAVAVNPDGKQVYVVSPFDSAVTIFTRDQSSGTLKAAGVVKNHVDNVVGMARANCIAVSPDGKNVYVGATGDSAVAVFKPNGDGLSFVMSVKSKLDTTVTTRTNRDGSIVYDTIFTIKNPWRGLFNVGSIEISPDGKTLYTTALLASAISEFARDPESGALKYIRDYLPSDKNFGGISTPRCMFLSADGKNAYVAGGDQNTLVSLATDKADDPAPVLRWMHNVNTFAQESAVFPAGTFLLNGCRIHDARALPNGTIIIRKFTGNRERKRLVMDAERSRH